MSSELGPILSGLVLGGLLGRLPAQRHAVLVGALVVPLLALLATFTSGELRLTWGFVLVDIPMVGLPACMGYFAFCVRRRVP
jgi:hypothetical protein